MPADVASPHEYDFTYVEDEERSLPLPLAKQGMKGIFYRKYDLSLCTYCSGLNGVILTAIRQAWKGDPWDDVELLTGKMIDAQEAYRIGLINTVVPPDQVLSTAKEWANTILAAGPLAVRAAKQAMLRGCDTTLDEGLRLESALCAYLMGTDDFNEGTKAFVEKRKPVWKGR